MLKRFHAARYNFVCMKHKTVSIIGGGIAGLAAAIALKNIGVETQIFEASKQLGAVGAGLGLGINAMIAFKELGIYSDVVLQGKALPSFSIYDQLGNRISKTNFGAENGIGNFTIHRAKLHEVLLSQIDPSTIHLGKRLINLENSDFAVKLFFEDGSAHHTNYLIAADGIHSPVRQKLLPGISPRYAGYTCWRAVIDGQTLNIDETSETWGANGRFGIVPLKDRLIYWFACINAQPNDPVLSNYKVEDLYNQFKNYHAPIPDVLSLTKDQDLIHNDISDINPVKHFSFGRSVLIGDAAHATTPNMGQGACQAIEDAVVIGQCMADQPDFELAFKKFEECRMKRTTWVTDTSRKIGQIAQWENRFLIHLRNAAFRRIPSSLTKKQLRKIGNVDFKTYE